MRTFQRFTWMVHYPTVRSNIQTLNKLFFSLDFYQKDMHELLIKVYDFYINFFFLSTLLFFEMKIYFMPKSSPLHTCLTNVTRMIFSPSKYVHEEHMRHKGIKLCRFLSWGKSHKKNNVFNNYELGETAEYTELI